MSESEQKGNQPNSEENPNIKEENISLSDETKTTTSTPTNIDIATNIPPEATPAQAAPKPEEIVVNPTSDVVEVFDSVKDCQWGWGFQYPDSKILNEYWLKVVEKTPKKAEFTCTINWFSQDTEGFIPNEATKQYLIFWSWGYKIDAVKKWFKDTFPNFPSGIKELHPSSDLAKEYWQDMPLQKSISIDGTEIIELPQGAPRRKSPVPVEKSHPISANIPRYWSATSNRGVRDWLIPVITSKSVESKKIEPDGYLEEYIVEQVDYKVYNHPDTNTFIAFQLPEEFNAQEGDEIPFTIPPKFRRPLPKFDYPGLGYPGMDFGNQNFDENMDDLGDEDLDMDDAELDNEPAEPTEHEPADPTEHEPAEPTEHMSEDKSNVGNESKEKEAPE